MQQSVLFPLPLKLHILYAVVGIVFFIISFIRKKRYYKLIMIEAIASTMLIYLCTKDSIFFTVLGFIEFIQVAAALVLRHYELKLTLKPNGEHFK